MRLITLVIFVLTSNLALSSSGIMLDPDGQPRRIHFENIEGYAITEGDIILGKINNNFASVITSAGGRRWPNGIVPFMIDKNLPRQTRVYLNEALSVWRKNAGIIFVRITKRNKNRFKDYVYIQPSLDQTCSSSVGRKGGAQVMLLAARCNKMNIVHEFGHALGLWHEQSRNDRDQYVNIVWDNIKEESKHNFNQHLYKNIDMGPYNYDSIMHYSAYAFSKNNEKTIIPLQSDIVIGQRDHLSIGDIQAIQEIYSSSDTKKSQ